MAMIQVTAGKLREAADGLQNLNGQFKNKSTELGEKGQVLCQMWEGQAKTAFQGAFTRDCQQMEAFHQLMNQYIQALLEIAAGYEQAEAKNAEIASMRSY